MLALFRFGYYTMLGMCIMIVINVLGQFGDFTNPKPESITHQSIQRR